MMKSVNDSSTDNNNNNNNNNNWLGMKMDSGSHHHHHHETQVSYADSVTANFFLSPYYGVSENGGFHHSSMPLKSDGSLCTMDSFTQSQGSSPKLEDFLGGHEREAMALSLNSMYNNYHQNPEPENQHFLHLLHNPYNQQQIYMPHHEIYQNPLQEQDPKQTHLQNYDVLFPQMSENEKNWIARHYDQMNTNTSLIEASGSMGGGDLQSLTLSMSPGSQSSCVIAPRIVGSEIVVAIDTKKKASGKVGQKQPVHRKSIDTFGQRTSQYRGVTRHRWTGRYEAHLWDNSSKKEGQTRKGRQVYLGGYDMEEKAARAYDLAALKYWGAATHINFPVENYQEQLEEMKKMSRQEFVAHLRRKSSGFSRGASMYRGVTRHHQHGRWQARIGRVAGNKDLYLGTFSTQEEAAEAYDVAAIKFRGVNAVTNFDIQRYDVERIMASNTLLGGEMAKRNKELNTRNEDISLVISTQNNVESTIIQSQNNNKENCSDWKMVSQPSFLMAEDQQVKLGNPFSNASSLVTSLGSSREASPERNGPSKFATSWPGELSMSHFPVFAAWSDT